MSSARHHAEWLNLVPASGPFLSMKVLLDVFPDGLDKRADDPELRANLRLAQEEWLDDQGGLKPDEAIHQAWIRFVLREALELDDEALVEGQALPELLTVRIPEHGETLRPDLAVVTPKGRPDAGVVRLLIQTVPSGQNLEGALTTGRWKVSPATRMMTLLHGASASKSPVKLGLVTNGDHWMLVHAIAGETTTYASFYASLFSEEPLTLRAFTSLLSSHRFFGVPNEDPTKSEDDEKGQTLEALFKRSAKNQADVTDQLGYQVRRAVEQLIQSIDRVDRDRGRELLRGFDEKRLYEAAVTVMMRLVFLLAAEERKLLPLGQPLYDQHYAVSTLLAQLQEVADRHGQEVLSRRYDAWSRLLATFRAVHDGVRHEDLKLPAYGGSLFDADRYPFLEGRPADSKWKETAARPLAIDNLTVLDVLRSIQVLEVKVPGGGPAEARRLSFRALGVEQIGHVYEGLLDHTAKRAKGPVVSLRGAKDKEPEVEVEDLDAIRAAGEAKLLDWLRKETGRSASALKKAVAYQLPREDHRKWMLACENNDQLYQRVTPYAGLVRDDVHGHPVVFDAGAVYVTEGLERRATGTHYTPRSLTEPIVQYTLEPLVYEGPAEGWDKEKWALRSAKEILDLKVCDMAMGSGAFLVQACRYMSERVVEAWEEAERKANGRLVITPNGDFAEGDPSERHVPTDPEERLAIARRLVADRCLYGVDKNPMAVEMAKLSLWLVTLQKDKPFTFVDHSLRCGDSLLGLTSIDQLTSFHLDPKRGRELHRTLFALTKPIEAGVKRARELREKIASFAVNGIDDARKKEWMLQQSERALADLGIVGDLVIGAALSTAGKNESVLDAQLEQLSRMLPALFEDAPPEGHALVAATLKQRASQLIDAGREPQHAERRTFHWALEFPEVFGARGGFDAFVGNPPFQGGQRITGALGTDYRDHVVERIANGARGSADLVAYFFLRAASLLCDGGLAGMIATNTLIQGDTREVALDALVAGRWDIVRGRTSREWPGGASLEVVDLWIRCGAWKGDRHIDGQPVASITPYLTPPGLVVGKPHRLAANSGRSFQGSNVLGLAFTLTPEQAQELVRRESRNREVLFPYLNGRDLNSNEDQSGSRFVIYFREWPLDRETAPQGYVGPVAADYPDCLEIVRRGVKPERDRLMGRNATANDRALRWWQFARPTRQLYRAIDGMSQVLVVGQTSKYHSFVLVDAKQVFDQKLVVFTTQLASERAVLSSSFHTKWVLARGSSLETRPVYTPTDCFETFPFPVGGACLDGAAESYEVHRSAVMSARAEGLTKVYNRFHSRDDSSADIKVLRELHCNMDSVVAAAYHWTDLSLGHGFHDTSLGVRYTISERACREVLDRLLALNHERYAEEVRQGLHDKKSKSAKKRKSPARSQPPAAPTSSRPRRTGPAQIAFDLGEPPPPQIGLEFDADTSTDETNEHLSTDAAALLGAIRDRPEPSGKSELLEAAGIAAGNWTAAINELKDRGLIEQIGERRGARYQWSSNGEE